MIQLLQQHDCTRQNSEGNPMNRIEHTVRTAKSFDEAVRAVEQLTAEKGFRVLHVHDVAQTLAEKAFSVNL
jgi:uncharacterized protein (DUF302 family)